MRTNLLCAIGDRITQIRGSRSRPVFARELGVHKNTLVNYEKGDTSVGAEFLHQLADQGFNINWVLTGEGPQMRAADTAASAPGAVDIQLLAQIIQMMRQHQDKRGRRYVPEDEAAIIAKMYQYVIEEDAPTPEDRARVMRLVSKILGGLDNATTQGSTG